MGFSTSGSLLVIFVGVFLALGTMYTVSSNATDAVSSAAVDQHEQQERVLDTRIDVTDALWHTTDGNLTVQVDNAGAAELTVSGTSVLVDGEHDTAEAFDHSQVDGTETDLWGIEEQLVLERSTDQPTRVKVVTEVGVAAVAPVSVGGLEPANATAVDTTQDGVEETLTFELPSTYEEQLALQSVTVTETETDATSIDRENEAELVVNNETATATVNEPGALEIGDPLVPDERLTLATDETATYHLGSYRDARLGHEFDTVGCRFELDRDCQRLTRQPEVGRAVTFDGRIGFPAPLQFTVDQEGCRLQGEGTDTRVVRLDRKEAVLTRVGIVSRSGDLDGSVCLVECSRRFDVLGVGDLVEAVGGGCEPDAESDEHAREDYRGRSTNAESHRFHLQRARTVWRCRR